MWPRFKVDPSTSKYLIKLVSSHLKRPGVKVSLPTSKELIKEKTLTAYPAAWVLVRARHSQVNNKNIHHNVYFHVIACMSFYVGIAWNEIQRPLEFPKITEKQTWAHFDYFLSFIYSVLQHFKKFNILIAYFKCVWEKCFGNTFKSLLSIYLETDPFTFLRHIKMGFVDLLSVS